MPQYCPVEDAEKVVQVIRSQNAIELNEFCDTGVTMKTHVKLNAWDMECHAPALALSAVVAGSEALADWAKMEPERAIELVEHEV